MMNSPAWPEGLGRRYELRSVLLGEEHSCSSLGLTVSALADEVAKVGGRIGERTNFGFYEALEVAPDWVADGFDDRQRALSLFNPPNLPIRGALGSPG